MVRKKLYTVCSESKNTPAIHPNQTPQTNLILGGKLDDLGAEVGTLDGAQVLLVRLLVARVLVEHVGRARLHLRLHDRVPQLLGPDLLAEAALLFVLLIQRLELLAVNLQEQIFNIQNVSNNSVSNRIIHFIYIILFIGYFTEPDDSLMNPFFLTTTFR